MPNEQNQMKKRYRVCLLAYSRVAHVAREVVRELADSDIEYIILESGLADEQAACVEEARRLGCEVFIAGRPERRCLPAATVIRLFLSR